MWVIEYQRGREADDDPHDERARSARRAGASGSSPATGQVLASELDRGGPHRSKGVIDVDYETRTAARRCWCRCVMRERYDDTPRRLAASTAKPTYSRVPAVPGQGRREARRRSSSSDLRDPSAAVVRARLAVATPDARASSPSLATRPRARRRLRRRLPSPALEHRRRGATTSGLEQVAAATGGAAQRRSTPAASSCSDGSAAGQARRRRRAWMSAATSSRWTARRSASGDRLEAAVSRRRRRRPRADSAGSSTRARASTSATSSATSTRRSSRCCFSESANHCRFKFKQTGDRIRRRTTSADATTGALPRVRPRSGWSRTRRSSRAR